MIRPRRAVSLIELLLVMSACTSVLTLSSVLLVRAMRIQTQSRVHADAERTALRLANQFRRDVHRAQTAVLNRNELERDVVLRLQLADGQRVDYALVGSTLLRLAAGSDNRAAREEFFFPPGCEFSVRELEAPPRLAITIAAKPNFGIASDGTHARMPGVVPVSLCVEASLGRDARFAAAVDRQEDGP
jgi:hypothetical protein